MYEYDPEKRWDRYENELSNLVGKQILQIQINDDYLVITTNEGVLSYMVTGDCCSQSYFHDFIGVSNILNNTVLGTEEIAVEDITEKQVVKEGDYPSECLQHYGYRIVTDHPKFGEVSAVVSFRNDSNGYYGGSIEEIDGVRLSEEKLTTITEDWIND